MMVMEYIVNVPVVGTRRYIIEAESPDDALANYSTERGRFFEEDIDEDTYQGEPWAEEA